VDARQVVLGDANATKLIYRVLHCVFVMVSVHNDDNTCCPLSMLIVFQIANHSVYTLQPYELPGFVFYLWFSFVIAVAVCYMSMRTTILSLVVLMGR
jgi:hypothetical protein